MSAAKNELLRAVENLIKQKGRHNTEIAYQRLVEAYDASLTVPQPIQEVESMLERLRELRNEEQQGTLRRQAFNAALDRLDVLASRLVHCRKNEPAIQEVPQQGEREAELKCAQAIFERCRSFLFAFVGQSFANADNPDRHNLGMALDNLEECSGILGALIDRASLHAENKQVQGAEDKPLGSVLLDANGLVFNFSPRVRGFFGAFIADDAYIHDADIIAKADREFAGNAPHRQAFVYLAAPQPAKPEDCPICEEGKLYSHQYHICTHCGTEIGLAKDIDANAASYKAVKHLVPAAPQASKEDKGEAE